MTTALNDINDDMKKRKCFPHHWSWTNSRFFVIWDFSFPNIYLPSQKNVMFYDFITNILLFSRHSSIYATGYFQHKLDTSTQYAPLTVSAEILGLHMVDLKDNLSSLLAMKPNIKNIQCKQNGDKFQISYLAQDCLSLVNQCEVSIGFKD